MSRLPFVVVVLCLLAGCTSAPHKTEVPVLTPREAIVAAAECAPSPFDGVFEMRVQAVGGQDGMTYLNSELDYRDQRNLTVVLAPAAAAGLRERLGQESMSVLVGKTIRVTGLAARMTIWFYCDGRRTNSYYYQTQVLVADAGQIEIQ